MLKNHCLTYFELLLFLVNPFGGTIRNPLKDKQKRFKWGLLATLCLILAAPVGWGLLKRLEGETPAIHMTLPKPVFGPSQPFSVSISDRKTGLRHLRIEIIQGEKTHLLLDRGFPSTGFFKKGVIRETELAVTLEPREMGITDGNVLIRSTVWDYSWRNSSNGNQRVAEETVLIDTVPPDIRAISNAHNVSQGGAGLVIYRLSEPCSRSGVHVGTDFYPGAGGYFEDPSVYLAMFALRVDQGRDTGIYLGASDRAGNTSRAAFRHYIRPKRFPRDTIRITDGFLKRKLPQFDAELSPVADKAPVDQFLYVNRTLRASAYERLSAVIPDTRPGMLWSGSFVRLPGSARQAGFGDRRIYTHNGTEVDRQFHLGVDLASVKHSPVPAANHGKVVFADALSIYGNSVVIDHGLGLQSMYAHLSRIEVEPNQTVDRGDIIGYTGSTGLAGGDHLHYAMLVHHTFVNPLEWWDAKWIENNVRNKIRAQRER